MRQKSTSNGKRLKEPKASKRRRSLVTTIHKHFLFLKNTNTHFPRTEATQLPIVFAPLRLHILGLQQSQNIQPNVRDMKVKNMLRTNTTQAQSQL